jgi:predicted adenylyl cyclase CyaB
LTITQSSGLLGYVFNPIEVEIKVWLKNSDSANQFKTQLERQGWSPVTNNNQLNHYFVGDNFLGLNSVSPEIFISNDPYSKLVNILTQTAKFSLRTRQKDNQVLLVIKASLDNTTSQNGIIRMEFEEEVNLTLNQLDEILLNLGFEYQAKWSRERQEFANLTTDITICIDKNAGYGYLAEFEKMISSDQDSALAKKEVLDLANSFGLEELDQSLLARMFDYYNNNWQEFYDQDNFFDEKDI